MNNKRVLGYFLVLAGISVIAVNFRLTGAVVGVGLAGSLWFIVGLAIMVGGIGLVIVGKELSDLVDMSEVVTRVHSIAPEKRSVVLDSSILIPYSPMKLRQHLKEYGEVYVPESVLDEIHSSARQVIEKNSKRIKGAEGYRKIATEYLNKSGKTVYYDTVVPIMLGEKEPPKTRREIEPLKRRTKKIMGWLEDAGKPVTKENILDVIEKHYQTSEADIDVLAYAIKRARHGDHAVVGERDTHFEHAIDMIKKEHPKIGAKIDYVNNYREAA